ncbi:MAG: cellulase family glycosylhydrolase [Patescibacteria group bacterium]
MSKFLISSGILLFILIIVLGFLINKKGANISQPKILSLPELYVEGNTIKRSDSDMIVQLKGVSTMAFAYDDYQLNQEFIKILDYLKLWKINLLGLYVDPLIIKNNLTKLDFVIEWAEKNHIYVFLTPRASDYRNLSDQLKQFPSMMNQLTKKYAQKNNILYGFFTEPNMTWVEWYKLADSIAKEIIKEKPNALMLMTGINHSRYIDFNQNLPYKNLVYDYHDYPAAGIDSLQSVLKKNDLNFLWDNAIGKYPVLVSEFGGVWESGFSSQEDLTYIQKVLDNINKNSLNYTAYTIDGDNGGLELIDWNTGLPTKKGELIKNDLLKYPPTDFSK